MASSRPSMASVLVTLALIFAYSSSNIKGCNGAEPKMVFAHYMLYSFLYTDDVAGFQREIQLARSYGIDAFALNTGVWNNIYQDRADKIYTAADQLGFKIFFSADMAGTLTVNQARTMITRYAGRGSQLRYNGQQFFSTFVGRSTVLAPYSTPLATWRDGVLGGGLSNSVFFVPFFETGGTLGDISYVFSSFNPILDGLMAWDTSAWPYVNGDLYNPSDAADRSYMQACSAAGGKVYMASVSPWFYDGRSVKGDYGGAYLWTTHWAQLARLQPHLVEVISWNDWGERHYVVPIGNQAASTPYGAPEINAFGYSHQAYLDLAGRYFIPWYKAGSPPPITTEALYLFHRSHSKNAIPSTVTNAAVLGDALYATVLLAQPSTVVLTSGSSAAVTFTGVVGFQNLQLNNFQEGQQSALVIRNGVVILSVRSNIPVSNNIQQYNFNVVANFATRLATAPLANQGNSTTHKG